MNYLYSPSKSVDIVKLIYSEQACVNILPKKKKKKSSVQMNSFLKQKPTQSRNKLKVTKGEADTTDKLGV